MHYHISAASFFGVKKKTKNYGGRESAATLHPNSQNTSRLRSSLHQFHNNVCCKHSSLKPGRKKRCEWHRWQHMLLGNSKAWWTLHTHTLFTRQWCLNISFFKYHDVSWSYLNWQANQQYAQARLTTHTCHRLISDSYNKRTINLPFRKKQVSPQVSVTFQCPLETSTPVSSLVPTV